jgi:hypothetical protein
MFGFKYLTTESAEKSKNNLQDGQDEQDEKKL